MSKQDSKAINLKTYINGFVLSIILTLGAYFLVVHHSLSHDLLVVSIAALALCQFVVQLVCFLHLGRETKPKWKFFVFWFMMMVVAILVIGSLWIMSNLNNRMTPLKINQYMNSQNGL